MSYQLGSPYIKWLASTTSSYFHMIANVVPARCALHKITGQYDSGNHVDACRYCTSQLFCIGWAQLVLHWRLCGSGTSWPFYVGRAWLVPHLQVFTWSPMLSWPEILCRVALASTASAIMQIYVDVIPAGHPRSGEPGWYHIYMCAYDCQCSTGQWFYVGQAQPVPYLHASIWSSMWYWLAVCCRASLADTTRAIIYFGIASFNQVQRQQQRDEPVRENTHLLLDTLASRLRSYHLIVGVESLVFQVIRTQLIYIQSIVCTYKWMKLSVKDERVPGKSPWWKEENILCNSSTIWDQNGK